MAADDAWSAEIKRLPFTPDPDPLALDDDLAERLLDGDIRPDQAPPRCARTSGGPSSSKAAASGCWASSTSASERSLASKATWSGGPSSVPAANRFCTFQVSRRNCATHTSDTRHPHAS
jgi:hypothetical protein